MIFSLYFFPVEVGRQVQQILVWFGSLFFCLFVCLLSILSNRLFSLLFFLTYFFNFSRIILTSIFFWFYVFICFPFSFFAFYRLIHFFKPKKQLLAIPFFPLSLYPPFTNLPIHLLIYHSLTSFPLAFSLFIQFPLLSPLPPLRPSGSITSYAPVIMCFTTPSHLHLVSLFSCLSVCLCTVIASPFFLSICLFVSR